MVLTYKPLLRKYYLGLHLSRAELCGTTSHMRGQLHHAVRSRLHPRVGPHLAILTAGDVTIGHVGHVRHTIDSRDTTGHWPGTRHIGNTIDLSTDLSSLLSLLSRKLPLGEDLLTVLLGSFSRPNFTVVLELREFCGSSERWLWLVRLVHLPRCCKIGCMLLFLNSGFSLLSKFPHGI